MLQTVSDLHGKFLHYLTAEVLARRLKQGTIDYYRRQLRPFVQAHGAALVVELVPYDLLQLHRTWHSVQAVQRMFAWGCDAGLVDRHPFIRVQRPAPGQRDRILNRQELVQLIQAANRPTRRILLALRHTLARPQELRNLTWPMYRADIQAFALTDFKGRSRRKDGVRLRWIALDGWMLRMVLRWRSRATGSHVFLNYRGYPWTCNGLRLAVRRACVRAGLDGEGERIVAYSLRHTAATWATAEGVLDRRLAELLGHASTRTTARYQHLQIQHLLEAVRQATGG